MSRAYVEVRPDRVGWVRLSGDTWRTNCGRRITLSFSNPIVHVPADYPGLITEK